MLRIFPNFSVFQPVPVLERKYDPLDEIHLSRHPERSLVERRPSGGGFVEGEASFENMVHLVGRRDERRGRRDGRRDGH